MAGCEAPERVSAHDLQRVFDATFRASHNVCLRGGAIEPLYEPATATEPAVIHFRADYPRSALHEVAHWCHAGHRRRQLVDYGYWYSPDDRNALEQAAFFAVEARPQALESLFCSALGLPFEASIDNLSLPVTPSVRSGFEQRIQQALAHYRCEGLPARAAAFCGALQNYARRLQ